MQNKSMNFRLAAIALVTLFTVAAVTPALAIDGNLPAAVELKFIGNLKNQPMFQLSFNGAEETDYTVAVVDEYNNVLYKENVKASGNAKKFLLNTEEISTAGLRFEITGKKSNKTVVFEINRNSRVVEDLVISKIK